MPRKPQLLTSEPTPTPQLKCSRAIRKRPWQRHPSRALWLLFVFSAPARAATVEGSSTSFIGVRPDWRDGQVHTIVPAIEWISVSARNIEAVWVDDLRISLSGWAGFNTPSNYNPESGGDVDVAYIQGAWLKRRLTFRLGRQFQSTGVARTQMIDGLTAEAMVWRKLGVTAYGGAPVVPRFAVARGDWLVGGRIFWRESWDSEIGASFIQVYDHGLTARTEIGADARYAPRRDIALTGYASWSITEQRFAQADLSAQWQTSERLLVLIAARHVAVDLLIPRTSLFSVFAADERTETGGEMTWQATRKASLTASAFALWVGSATGWDASAFGSYSLSSRQRFGAKFRTLHSPSKGYVEGRVWFQHWWSPFLSGSIDLQSDWFDVPINGRRFSSTASANILFAFAPDWSAAVSGLAGMTPFFNNRLEAMAKLVYRLPDLGRVPR